jgi:hypothetical protein
VAAGDKPLLGRVPEIRTIGPDLHERTRVLRSRFTKTNAAALRALEAEDYLTLRSLIEAERGILEEQAQLIQEHFAIHSLLFSSRPDIPGLAFF